ncbi:MAG TPA: hypothetical protein VKA30_01135 [Actinomycetota bacterium]|nr:hypothetical protein [Actinomycetota bacterium]
MRRALQVYGVGFVFLLGGGVGAALSHFTASKIAPWLSIGSSGIAVVLTLAALSISRRA